MSILLTEPFTGVYQINLDRPEKRNAFDDEIINELISVLEQCKHNNNCRVLIVTGNGKAFSAGADLAWMQRMKDYSEQDNLNDSLQLAKLMHTLYTFPHPTLAAINGPAFGGAVGLVSCCDIAIASTHATFCLSEVKLGIIPSVISPYVIKAIGERMMRYYALTADLINAETAKTIQLIHRISIAELLLEDTYSIAKQLIKNGPQALMHTKQLIHDVTHQAITPALIVDSAERIAKARVSDEGQQGLNAFLNKQPVQWSN